MRLVGVHGDVRGGLADRQSEGDLGSALAYDDAILDDRAEARRDRDEVVGTCGKTGDRIVTACIGRCSLAAAGRRLTHRHCRLADEAALAIGDRALQRCGGLCPVHASAIRMGPQCRSCQHQGSREQKQASACESPEPVQRAALRLKT